MKKLIISALCLFCFAPAFAQKPELAWDAYYRYYFENRELDYNVPAPIRSGTINAMYLTPSISVGVFQNPRVHHRLAAGTDIRRNMGAGEGRFAGELSVYYDVHLRLRNGAMFEGVIGIFPRRFSEGEYGRIFFSDSLRFTDSNSEGLLLKYRSEDFYAELGADWMGMRGREVKERFMLTSAGAWDAASWLRLGWSGSFYHYAGSEKAPGVVDHHLFEPYVTFDLADAVAFQELSLKLGAPATYQRDREREDSPSIKIGAEALLTAKKWNVGISNSAFYGRGFQYLYNGRDLGGNKYGNMLYFGSPFYSYDFYDMLEISYAPEIWRGVYLNIGARFHFCEKGFIGNSQTLGLVFDLGKIKHPHWGAGRTEALPSRRRGGGPTYFM